MSVPSLEISKQVLTFVRPLNGCSARRQGSEHTRFSWLDPGHFRSVVSQHSTKPGEAVETDEKPQVEALSHAYARPGSGNRVDRALLKCEDSAGGENVLSGRRKGGRGALMALLPIFPV